MSRSHAEMVTYVRNNLVEPTVVLWSDAVIAHFKLLALRDISHIVPRFVGEELGVSVEARSGTATSTLANNLVDATNAHFLATDVGKVIYNTTDYTFAKIITYTSTTTVALSNNIMASGEGYEIYNQKCHNQKQIYIGDILNNIILPNTPNRVEYPIGTYHNYKVVAEDILEILMDSDPDTDYKLGFIDFARYHKLPNLTDWAGAVNNAGGYAAGAVSMVVNGLGADTTMPEGTEFTIANVRGIYTVSADATIAANAATITFFPGLDAAVINAQVVNFTKSTLTPQLESILADYTCGLIAISYSRTLLNAISLGGGAVWKNYEEWGKSKIAQAMAELGRVNRIAISHLEYPR